MPTFELNLSEDPSYCNFLYFNRRFAKVQPPKLKSANLQESDSVRLTATAGRTNYVDHGASKAEQLSEEVLLPSRFELRGAEQ